MRIFLYGPPGSGKTTAGRCLAQQLGLPFYDLDQEIQAATKQSIPEIFAGQGEPRFREIESRELKRFFSEDEFVLALGGGTLLDDRSKAAALNAGRVVCLSADLDALAQRLSAQAETRPLLRDDVYTRLEGLLHARSEHYASFPLRVDTTLLSPVEIAWQILPLIGRFRMNSMADGTDVYAQSGALSDVGNLFNKAGLWGPVLVVTDDHVAPLYAGRVVQSLKDSGLPAASFMIPSGESHKTLDTASSIWEAMLDARLDRKSTLLALGGGVVTDLAGFAAATFLRGIHWAVVPTTLLGMVDASLGGKTGIDLPQGKNLVGAFYPPRLVLADPDVLVTLPEVEQSNGLAETLKHAILASPELFRSLSRKSFETDGWEAIVRHAMAVKMRVIEEDPYEQGKRVTLNLGHTVGHAVERASSYRLRHGEAVAIGMVVEARIGETLGITQAGTADAIGRSLSALGLPVSLPSGLEPSELRQAIGVDKKRRSGKIILPLPVTIGQVRYDIEIEEQQLWNLFLSCTAQT